MLPNDVLVAIGQSELPLGGLRRQTSSISVINRLADGLIIAGSLALACSVSDACRAENLIIAYVGVSSLYLLFAALKNLYKSWRTESIRKEVWAILDTWLSVTGASFFVLYTLQDSLLYPPRTMLLWFLTTPVLLGAWRALTAYTLHRARAKGYFQRRLAIVGAGDLARHVAKTVEDNPWMGLQIAGFYTALNPQQSFAVWGKHHVRSFDTLLQEAKGGEIDVVYITESPRGGEIDTDTLIRKLSDSTVSVYLVQERRSQSELVNAPSRQPLPDLWRIDVLSRSYVDIAGIKAVSVYETPFMGPDGWLKRVEDIVVSAVALTLFALPMAIIAFGVKASSPGPVFFKQRRYGLDGRPILVWKFRSMSVCEDAGSIEQARKGDSRVTPFGAFLRRTSLDELPQLINVLMGSMSIVGPRPHAISHNEYFRQFIGGYMLRHKVKPGITGWAQVHGWRGETDTLDKMGRRVDFDLDYIRNWSLALDLQIMFMTLFKGFMHKNAY